MAMTVARNRWETQERRSRSAPSLVVRPVFRRLRFARRILAAVALCACILGPASGEVYKYQDENGRWIFSDKPQPGSVMILPSGHANARPKGARSNPVDVDGRQDLAERLRTATEPASPIQQCRLAVVKIDSEIANGSGFFVTDDGLILTNRHVVRPPKDAFAQAEDRLVEAELQLKRMKQELDRQGRPCGQYTNKGDCKRAYRNHRDAAFRLNQTQLNLFRLKGRTGAAKSFTIHLQDKTELKASLVAVSSKHDMALLQLTGYRTPFISPLTGRTLADAETLYVIGSPLGIADQISSGDYTGTHHGLLGTNAKVLPGNSGGPMVTREGQVVGVVTIKVTAGEDPSEASGLGFAIPIDKAFEDFPQITP